MAEALKRQLKQLQLPSALLRRQAALGVFEIARQQALAGDVLESALADCLSSR